MLSDNGSFYIYNISSVVYCLGDTKSPKLTQTSIYNKGIHLQGGGGGGSKLPFSGSTSFLEGVIS